MKNLRILLFPFSFLYGCIVFVRNKFYDWKIFASTEYEVKTIVVGNLSAGGTGKSPHIEYLIRLLIDDYELATLSRGYGRKTRGYFMASGASTAADVGDEPIQFKRKFKDIRVAVDGSRVSGIRKLMSNYPHLNVILLDDAFQHRPVTPGLSILVTDYNNLYSNDYLLPVGTLREQKSGAKRADIIIVSKCPETISEEEKNNVRNQLNVLAHQKLYFSFIRYTPLIEFYTEHVAEENYFNNGYSVLLVSGIASPKKLMEYLENKFVRVHTFTFPDHHVYSINDLKLLRNIFENTIEGEKKIILTTEKDAMRLINSEYTEITETMPLFYIPIEIDFREPDKTLFNQQISDYVKPG